MLYNNTAIQKNESLHFQKILSLIAHKTNYAPKIYGKGYKLRCPAHEDKNPSLSASSVKDGTVVLLKCFTGCSLETICYSIGIRVRDLFSKKTKK